MGEPIDKLPTVLYEGHVFEIQRTPQFDKWLRALRDRHARLRIVDRLERLSFGHAGDTKPVGGDLHELRIAFGPGYRIYYMWKGNKLILLLSGGDKDSQTRDIAKAKALAREADDGIENITL